nr:hypothetical protein [Candidatus Sigynarchaeota archaeon]
MPRVNLFPTRMSKRVLTRYYSPLVIGIYAMLLVIARLLYPYIPSYPYGWITSTISRLGWPEENVTGWFFFSAAFLVLGLGTIPVAMHYRCGLGKVNATLAKLVSIFLLVACIGEILIGAVPNFNTPDKMFLLCHSISAFASFGGTYLMALFMFIGIAFRKKVAKIEWHVSSRFVAVYAIILAFGLVCTVLMIATGAGAGLTHYHQDPSVPLIASMPFWEWQSFHTMLVVGYLPLFIVPEA